MKKLILLSTLLFSGISLQAGEVFPTSDAIWNMHLYINFELNSEIIYGLIGDTIIQDRVYHKMYILKDTVLTTKGSTYVGGFRSDEKKVWFYPPVTYWNEQFPEFLLYDFSKEKGDTVKHGMAPYILPDDPELQYTGPSNEFNSVITETYIDDQGRKHIKTSLDEWIEGIGGRLGFFKTFFAYATDGIMRDHYLACFKTGEKVEYLANQVCDKCFCMKLYPGYVDIKNNEEEVSFILSVNPQKSEIQIQTPPSLQPAELNLYDLSGVLIYSQILSRSYSSIELSSFQPGIYIYRINKLGKSLQSGKICIQ